MKNKPIQKPYLTPTEVADLLMVSPVTVRQWSQKGLLPAETTPGGHRRYLRREVERFARERGLTVQADDNGELRVLIVDDDLQLARYLVELLSDRNPPVTTEVANDGFDAGQKVRTFSPHVILLDLMMPGLDGFGVCQHLKQDPSTRRIRIIGMTGFYTPTNVARILAAGADLCLPKPLEEAKLLEALRTGTVRPVSREER